jgi:aspartate/methionine/tyrosine aminotransferase
MDLLNATGICLVPGSGFKQVPGTWHFRSTFLPPENQLDEFIGLIKDFHSNWMKQWK